MPPRARPSHRAGAARCVWALAVAAALTLGGIAPAFTLAPAFAAASATAAAQSPAVSVQTEVSAKSEASTESETVEPNLTPHVTLAPKRAVLLSSDESMDFEFWVVNPGEGELGPGRVSLMVNAARVTDAAVLTDPATSADRAESVVAPMLEVDVPPVPAGEGRLVTLSVPRTVWPLTAAEDAGVYLASARYSPTGSFEQFTTETPLVWRGAGGLSTVPLTTIVPFTLPEAIPSLPRRGQLEELYGPDSQLEALLTLAEERGATLAIDPRVVAGVRVYGETASTDARSFIDRLVTTTAPSFALQFADADPAAQAALGFTRLLAPEGLSFASRFGVFPDPAPTNLTPGGGGSADQSGADTSAPDPADATDLTRVPTIGELTSWPTSLPGTAWPAAGSVNRSVLDLLGLNGYNRVLASAENVSVAGGGARGSSGNTEYLVSDEALDSAARSALSAESETGRLAGVALTSALLALHAQAETPGVVLALDRQAMAESPDAATLLETILTLQWVTTTAPTELPESVATLSPAAEAAAPSRAADLAEAVAREPEVRDYSRVLVDPQNLIDLQRVRLLQLLSARYTAPGGDFADAANRSAERDADTLQGVQVVSSPHTQLIGTTSQVPVQLRNTLPFDALLTAVVSPTSAALIVTTPTVEPTLVPGESSANMLVPVRARVSSGESALSVAVSAASGGDVVTRGQLDISIRSSWETLALGALGAFTAIFFGFGIWRSIRHRRAHRASSYEGIAAP